MSDTAEQNTTRRRVRGGGGAARRAERTAVVIETARFIERNIPNFEVLNEEALKIIEFNAETVLEEIGVNFPENPKALQRWKNAGANVDGDRVRIPRGLARKLIKTAPAKFTQHARNPEKNVEIGGNTMVLAPVYGPPFIRDLEGGRRYATISDFHKIVKLTYMSKYLHHSGGTVCEPTDIAVNKRHLDMLYAHMTLTDKPFMGSVTAPQNAQDSVNMCNILFGEDFVQNNTVMTSLININSPMVFDDIMMGAMEVYAENNQACIVSPFIVGGAMAPVSVAGTFSYKNIDFSLSAVGSFGNNMVRDYQRFNLLANKGERVLDRWTPTNPSNTEPRATSGASINTDLFSDYYVEDASFVRIQNVQLGYTFDKDILEKIKLNSLRMFLSANNLHTFTNYSGYDPSASSGDAIGGGIDRGFYPVAKTFILGLSLTF